MPAIFELIVTGERAGVSLRGAGATPMRLAGGLSARNPLGSNSRSFNTSGRKATEASAASTKLQIPHTAAFRSRPVRRQLAPLTITAPRVAGLHNNRTT